MQKRLLCQHTPTCRILIACNYIATRFVELLKTIPLINADGSWNSRPCAKRIWGWLPSINHRRYTAEGPRYSSGIAPLPGYEYLHWQASTYRPFIRDTECQSPQYDGGRTTAVADVLKYAGYNLIWKNEHAWLPRPCVKHLIPSSSTRTVTIQQPFNGTPR